MDRMSVMVSTFPRSGARYFSAFLSANFKEYVGFSPCQVETPIMFPDYNHVIKTHSERQEDFDSRFPTFYIVRDYRDAVATLIENDDIPKDKAISYNIPSWKRHVDQWATSAHVNVIRYEDLVTQPDRIINKLSSLLNIEPCSNATRIEELKEATREIGLYKKHLTDEQLEEPENLLKETLHLIDDRIDY